MPPSFPQPATKPYQIICEGPDDAGLISRLCRARNIGDCEASFSKPNPGKDGFSERISAVKTIDGIRGIALVADCDDDPIGRFKAARKHMEHHKELAVPARAGDIEVHGKSGIKTGILMIPEPGHEGGLETILLESLDMAAFPFAACADAFCACVNHPKTKLDGDKLRLRAIIASSVHKDPSLSVAYWLASGTRPFDLNHGALNRIETFLNALRA
jgi:hypothetical protein